MFYVDMRNLEGRIYNIVRFGFNSGFGFGHCFKVDCSKREANGRIDFVSFNKVIWQKEFRSRKKLKTKFGKLAQIG